MTSLRRTSISRSERLRLLGETDHDGKYTDANTGEKFTLEQTDLGHKQGYEERALRSTAERLNFSQAEYNDMIRHSEDYIGSSIFQPEGRSNNRSHRFEAWDRLIASHNARNLCSAYRQAQREGRTHLQMKQAAKQQSQEQQAKMQSERQQKAGKQLDAGQRSSGTRQNTAGRDIPAGKGRGSGSRGISSGGKGSGAKQSAAAKEISAGKGRGSGSRGISSGGKGSGSSGGHGSSSSGGHGSGSSGGHGSGSSGGHSGGSSGGH